MLAIRIHINMKYFETVLFIMFCFYSSVFFISSAILLMSLIWYFLNILTKTKFSIISDRKQNNKMFQTIHTDKNATLLVEKC